MLLNDQMNFTKRLFVKMKILREKPTSFQMRNILLLDMGFMILVSKKNDTITKQQAEKRLDLEVKQRIKSINKLIDNFDKYPEYLRGPIFSEHYRGSIQQSPKARKLINEGKFSEAADEFLDNDQYRNADKLKIPGIKARMERVSDALKKYGNK